MTIFVMIVVTHFYLCLRLHTELEMEHLSYKRTHPDLSDVPTDDDIDSSLPENERQFIQDLQLHKGKCPEFQKGVHHHIMKLAWYPNNIETILETEDQTLIYSFYRVCVSRTVGKRKWNEYSKKKLLHEFVTPADEALAMLIVENNVAKWMSEIRFPTTLIPAERFRTLYTQGDKGRKWMKAGRTRFMQLMKKMRNYRVQDELKAKYKSIEQIILRKEQSLLGIEVGDTSNIENSNNNSDEDDEDDEEMEREFLALANGE